MDNIYREVILEHYKHPHNFGTLQKPSSSAQESVISCGDEISMELEIKNGKLVDVAFSGQGCAISMAAASLLTDSIKGKEVVKLQALIGDDILSLLGVNLTPTRLKCALLSLEVLHKALNK
ncbi:SUF system NifU family Fe-S cluster assembly protein [Candidatus Microgenomates bacterium]|nr:MAG: SUF system NifU family Fe-S cluster assembly protein [Candidatus Microgenomates bacterium]